jgi:NADPH-dependent 2,4-dienoyl-CoA reductase/sulfur reductase-like enzyme
MLSKEIPLVDFLLIGGGLASATAAETLRAAGAEGGIAILSAERLFPTTVLRSRRAFSSMGRTRPIF